MPRPKTPKKQKGTANSITLMPYAQTQLEKLAEKKQLKKSAVITIALEEYARKELGEKD